MATAATADPVSLAWLAYLLLALLVLVAVFHQAPKCPRCGSFRIAHRYELLSRVRQCGDCHEIYEVRD